VTVAVVSTIPDNQLAPSVGNSGDQSITIISRRLLQSWSSGLRVSVDYSTQRSSKPINYVHIAGLNLLVRLSRLLVARNDLVTPVDCVVADSTATSDVLHLPRVQAVR